MGRIPTPASNSSAAAPDCFDRILGTHPNDVEADGKPKSYELMPGLFDAARARPLRSEIYVDRAIGSIRLGGEHRRKTRAEYEAGNQFVEGDLE